MTVTEASAWKQTACILCECNCGIEVRLGGDDGRRFARIRGDKAHPASEGYTCEKALRLDHYQNPGGVTVPAGGVPALGERVTRPLRRRADGSFEVVGWDTAIAEVAARLGAVRDAHGGESIFYFGGGGQGNHLGGGYASASRAAFGSRYRSNALAQEKTGEFWVNGMVLGTNVRADFEHCDVALFVGKNPWHSHGFPRARTTLKEIARDPDRHMIVVDPRRTETADLADIHLQVRPGADAWLIAALAASVVDEGHVDGAWLATHATGAAEVVAALGEVDIARHCAVAGVPEAQVRAAARLIGQAGSVAVFEDLGVQMNLHSTLVSYLEKLVWLLTGNFGRPGTQFAPSALAPLGKVGRSEAAVDGPRSPVAGARLVAGLVPCNVIAEEILTEHPARYRAMIVESGNPAHSLADSPRMREALAALDTLVVIDVALTETARMADYVLPAPTQFEKYEATFFNFDFPRNVFHLRRPVLDPPDGPLPEPEIHARLVEATGALDGVADALAAVRAAAEEGRAAFADAFFSLLGDHPELGPLAPVVLYRTLGPSLPHGAASAALLWAAAHRCAQANPDGVARAGFGEGLAAGEALFDAILASPSGVVITDDDEAAVWRRVGTGDGHIHLAVPALLDELAGLAGEQPPGADDDWPFVLSAGERRSFSANTIIRDPAWRKRDPAGSLRVNPDDAARLGLVDGGRARVTTRRATAEVTVEVHDSMRPGHVSLPNGLGLDHPGAGGVPVVTGLAPNELTSSGDRDRWVGTPHHKHVRARVEAVGVAAPVAPAEAAAAVEVVA
ncbi:MAG TPA: molybdopterin-dependent oxidoreductase [Acidimicrobiales bacterium]|nr:molybdopterin-dependent oxidoreductase [Acidimicrobiales bacterium]